MLSDEQFQIGLTLAWFRRQFDPIKSCHQYQYWLNSGSFKSCSEAMLHILFVAHYGVVIMPENGLDASKLSKRNNGFVLIGK